MPDAPPLYGQRVFASQRRNDGTREPRPGVESLVAFLALNRAMRAIAGMRGEATVDRTTTTILRRTPR